MVYNVLSIIISLVSQITPSRGFLRHAIAYCLPGLGENGSGGYNFLVIWVDIAVSVMVQILP